jgi:uncharacterized protein YkwD
MRHGLWVGFVVVVVVAVVAVAAGATVARSHGVTASRPLAAVLDPGGGNTVQDGPDGARIASFDPTPEQPDTTYSQPAPGVSGIGPVGKSWARSVDLVASSCANADADPTNTPEPVVRAATLCLLNAERANAGLTQLTENGRLRAAARAHARDMVKRVYFSHDSPNGSTFVQRISRAHYVAPGYHWTAGENLAWGGGGLGTPRVIVREWMNSDEHRANILRAKFREVGIGIVLGAPTPGAEDAATYATEYGARTKTGHKKRRRRHHRRR